MCSNTCVAKDLLLQRLIMELTKCTMCSHICVAGVLPLLPSIMVRLATSVRDEARSGIIACMQRGTNSMHSAGIMQTVAMDHRNGFQAQRGRRLGGSASKCSADIVHAQQLSLEERLQRLSCSKTLHLVAQHCI